MAKSTVWIVCASSCAGIAVVYPLLAYEAFPAAYARNFIWRPYVSLGAALIFTAMAAIAAIREGNGTASRFIWILLSLVVVMIAPNWINAINNFGELAGQRAILAVDTQGMTQIDSEKRGNELCLDTCINLENRYRTTQPTEQIMQTINPDSNWTREPARTDDCFT